MVLKLESITGHVFFQETSSARMNLCYFSPLVLKRIYHWVHLFSSFSRGPGNGSLNGSLNGSTEASSFSHGNHWDDPARGSLFSFFNWGWAGLVVQATHPFNQNPLCFPVGFGPVFACENSEERKWVRPNVTVPKFRPELLGLEAP